MHREDVRPASHPRQSSANAVWQHGVNTDYPLGLTLGAGQFLDMCRTTANAGGDLVIAKPVAGHGPRGSRP